MNFRKNTTITMRKQISQNMLVLDLHLQNGPLLVPHFRLQDLRPQSRKLPFHRRRRALPSRQAVEHLHSLRDQDHKLRSSTLARAPTAVVGNHNHCLHLFHNNNNFPSPLLHINHSRSNRSTEEEEEVVVVTKVVEVITAEVVDKFNRQ